MSEVEKVRSAEKEADLDRKIQEIRRRNEELEERHKIVTEEAKQNGVPKSFQKATVHNGGGQQNKSGSNHTNLKTSETIPSSKKGNNNGIAESKGNQWSREWDRGKTSAEDWKMNVPEFGDHGNSYFKIDSANGSSSSGTPSSRGINNRRDSGGRGGGHPQQQRGGGASGGRGRPGPKPQTPHNPGFFHDDRCDEKADENGTAAPPKSNDGKQTDGQQKKFPPRNNNNFPRKPPTMNKSSENDKNQNDSSKPNMNVSNGFGPRQDRRGGGGATQHPPRNFNNQHPPRRDGAPGGSGGPRHHQNGVNGDTTNAKFERKSFPKTDGGKSQNVKDTSSNVTAAADKQRQTGPSNRGRNLKPFNKPANYSNPRQNKVLPQKSNKPSNNGTTKPQNPKLDKDGQAVKRLIDNIIDQVVRHERKEQKKYDEIESEENATENENAESNVKSENSGNENSSNEEKKKEEEEEKPKEEEKCGVEESKAETQTENKRSEDKNETKIESNNAENPIPEGNMNEAKSDDSAPTESKDSAESPIENSQKEDSKIEGQPKNDASGVQPSESQPQP